MSYQHVRVDVLDNEVTNVINSTVLTIWACPSPDWCVIARGGIFRGQKRMILDDRVEITGCGCVLLESDVMK